MKTDLAQALAVDDLLLFATRRLATLLLLANAVLPLCTNKWQQ